MVKAFKLVSHLEGISYLLLLFVGMPLKYYAGNPVMVKALGMPHGLLFIAYILFTLFICWKTHWGPKGTIIFLIASVLPFGTFYIVHKYV